MSDIAELERRITSALERIGGAVEKIPTEQPSAENSAEVETLKEELEAEKTANTQLEERLAQLRERQTQDLNQLEERVRSLGARTAEQERELNQLIQVNARLRDSNQKLREANEKGLADAHLVNQSMQSELESLRQVNISQKSELNALLAELKPVVEAAGEGN